VGKARLPVKGADAAPKDSCGERHQGGDEIRRLADLAESLHSRSWDVMEIVAEAASNDPAIAELHDQRRRARLANQRTVAKRLAELGALRDGTSVDTAADLIWFYTAPENYRMLVIERNWPAKRYRSWFRSAVATILT